MVTQAMQQILIQMLLFADWWKCQTSLFFRWTELLSNQEREHIHKHTLKKKTFHSMVFGDVIFPCRWFCKDQEGVAQQHSWHTREPRVVTDWTNPSHHKQAVNERDDYTNSLKHTDKITQNIKNHKEWLSSHHEC